MSIPKPVEEMKVKEIHAYSWTCPACGEDLEIRTAILKSYLSCPVCGITYKRIEISSSTWFLLKESRLERVAPRFEMVDRR